MTDPAEHPRYSISVAAELAGMHPQTLRMYDAKGLVSPRRTPGGTRRYSDSDVARLRKVTHLTTVLGLSLSGATHVLELEQTVVELLSRVDAPGGAARRCRRGACTRRCRRCIGATVAISFPTTPAKHPLRWTSRS